MEGKVFKKAVKALAEKDNFYKELLDIKNTINVIYYNSLINPLIVVNNEKTQFRFIDEEIYDQTKYIDVICLDKVENFLKFFKNKVVFEKKERHKGVLNYFVDMTEDIESNYSHRLKESVINKLKKNEVVNIIFPTFEVYLRKDYKDKKIYITYPNNSIAEYNL